MSYGWGESAASWSAGGGESGYNGTTDYNKAWAHQDDRGTRRGDHSGYSHRGTAAAASSADPWSSWSAGGSKRGGGSQDTWSAATQDDSWASGWGGGGSSRASKDNHREQNGWGQDQHQAWGKKEDSWGQDNGWGQQSQDDGWAQRKGGGKQSQNDSWGQQKGGGKQSHNDSWGQQKGGGSQSHHDSWGQSQSQNDGWAATGGSDWGQPQADPWSQWGAAQPQASEAATMQTWDQWNQESGGAAAGAQWDYTELGQDLVVPDWGSLDLVEAQMDLYEPYAEVANRSQEETDRLREERLIKIFDWEGPNPVPSPTVTFGQSPIPDWMEAGIKAKGYNAPTPIQAQVWPIAMSGRDLVGIAETGSGKTLAYVLPMVQHIIAQEVLQVEDGPVAIVMAPTRELVVQIQEHISFFDEQHYSTEGVRLGIQSLAVYGGTPVKEQGNKLMYEKIDAVVATPGRMIHLLNDGWTNLRRCTFVVLDEADEMMSKGFLSQMDLLLGQTRPDRQTMMFSATWPPEIQKLAEQHCHRAPVKIRIGTEGMGVCKDIQQDFLFPTTDDEKDQMLKDKISSLQAEDSNAKILIFCNSKAAVSDLAWKLEELYPDQVGSFTSDKRQEERLKAVQNFKEGWVPILISTQSLGRGMDIAAVRAVINYACPRDIETYIHQIGRTGRAGQHGYSLTFVSASNWREKEMAKLLQQVLKETNQTVPDQLVSIAEDQGGEWGGGGGGAWGGSWDDDTQQPENQDSWGAWKGDDKQGNTDDWGGEQQQATDDWPAGTTLGGDEEPAEPAVEDATHDAGEGAEEHVTVHRPAPGLEPPEAIGQEIAADEDGDAEKSAGLAAASVPADCEQVPTTAVDTTNDTKEVECQDGEHSVAQLDGETGGGGEDEAAAPAVAEEPAVNADAFQ
mmetsp:Transcript_36759/g.67385  ORF Transcript_36759/g.67385 Transcript_36759/m.67385 type:complete len:902 (+) Transcript_36759:42-2747(+)